jgi:hypothetical protein
MLIISCRSVGSPWNSPFKAYYSWISSVCPLKLSNQKPYPGIIPFWSLPWSSNVCCSETARRFHCLLQDLLEEHEKQQSGGPAPTQ